MEKHLVLYDGQVWNRVHDWIGNIAMRGATHFNVTQLKQPDYLLPRWSRNFMKPKVLQSPPQDSILCLFNPVHILLPKIHFYIILPFKPIFENISAQEVF